MMEPTPHRPAEDAAAARAARAGRRAGTLLDLLRLVETAVADGRPADVAMSAELRRHPEFGARDRRLYSGAVFACLRWRGWAGTLAADGPRAPVLAALLDAGRPQAAALDLLARTAGLDLLRWPDPPPEALEDKAEALAALTGRAAPEARALVPAWLPSALAVPEGAVAAEHLRRCVGAFQQRPPLWLRAVGCSAKELARRMCDAGESAAAHPPFPGAVRVDGHPHLASLEKKLGPCFETQDLASQVVGALCGVRPGGSWWDACAGGGGKTLVLAEAAGARGRVLATDVRPRMLDDLARRAARIGLRNIRTGAHDAAAPAPAGAAFDGVLVDAPCSGVGTWSRSPDTRWRTAADMPAEMARRQAAILDACASAVRPGGRLVYSVCTLTRAETLDVAAAFPARHPDFAPDPAPHPLGAGPAAAAHWVWPWDGPCGGMFIARWIRRRTA